MTSLAIDTAFGEHSRPACSDTVRDFGRGICHVAEETAGISNTRESRIGIAVVPRAHRPSTLLRVPGEREFDQLTIFTEMKIRSRVTAGSDSVRYLQFKLPRLFAG